jgi:hypothetical protein
MIGSGGIGNHAADRRTSSRGIATLIEEGRYGEFDRANDDNDDLDEDRECSMNESAGGGAAAAAAMMQQQVKQAAHHMDYSWRNGHVANGGGGVLADETTSSMHFDNTAFDRSSAPPVVGPPLLLQQLHLPDPMNAVLQGPAGAFRHFVRGWTTTDVTATSAATAAPSSSSSWIPPAMTLRHSVSTPAVHHGMEMRGEDTSIPPPIPLDPFQRSTSTPSAFTSTRSTSATIRSHHGSAFYALPSQQFLRHDTYQHDHRTSPHAFGPVQFYSLALLEHMSIEVEQQLQPKPTTPSSITSNSHKRSARKFLSEVRVLRRRRQNPPPAANNNTSDVVTIVTEAAGEESSSATITERFAGTAAAGSLNDELCCIDTIAEEDDGRAHNKANEQQQPNPNHPLLLARPPRSDRGRVSPLITTAPSSTMMRARSLSRRRSHSHSPQSSTTTKTRRGNVAGSLSLSAAFATLSTISETDREVMMLNKENNGRQQQTARPSSSGVTSPSSSSSQGSCTSNHHHHGAGSTVPRYVPSPREGASLPADRFFIDNRSTATTAARSSASVSARSSSSSASRSSGGGSSCIMKDDPPPPIFVSYAEDDNDDDGDDDDQSIGGYRGLLQGEQREESPSIMDEVSTLAMAPELVRPRSCHHPWRILSAPSEVVSRESAATAAEQLLLPLLFDQGGVEVQRPATSR